MRIPIHIISWMLIPYIYDVKEERKDDFAPEGAVKVSVNDAIRCWLKLRSFTHFTFNPDTWEISWYRFPKEDVSKWNDEIVKNSFRFDSGKRSDVPVIDEATILSEFWHRNEHTRQNEFFYMHLVQDHVYDTFIVKTIDVSGRFKDIYVFNGEELNGAQLRGKGESRWQTGLLNELDSQFYVMMAKRFYQATGILANQAWLDEVIMQAMKKVFPKELAENTIKFVTIDSKVDELISSKRFSDEVWPISNGVSDFWVEILLKEMESELRKLNIVV